VDGRWDFYFLRVDGQPASIYLDLGWGGEAPPPAFPVMAYVRVLMRAPRPDGLSSQEEFDDLIAVEDRLVAALTAGGAAIYVGRNTSGGCRDFYFYAPAGTAWEERASLAMGAMPDYRFQAGQRPDPEWSVYREFLYPGPRERERMQNRSVCQALEHDGDALSAPREIDHWACFPDAATRDAFVRRAGELGFLLREQDDGDAEHPECMARIYRVDVPAREGIDEVCLPLFDLAEECGGHYDGWECPVVRAGEPA